ncbi:MAG TPA: Rne/Rng family ribonuclease, partial [Edaphobacter sp.]|nr:Rne/Rng family ribonuclease [Edaphobacter sp.]
RDRGGRGRRGRSGNRDRQPLSDGTQPLDNPEVIRADFNRAPDLDSAPAGAPVERADGADLSEGAPGADGSRRWRGRRGRRRGRGPGQRDESPQLAGTEAQPGFPAEENSEEAQYDDSFDIDAAATDEAAPPRPVSNTAPIASAYPASDAPQENTGGRDRGGRDDRNRRGDRGDRSDRGDRGGRGRGGDQRRVPRGFAPKTSLYGVDNSPAHEESASSDGPAPEPFLLPGESLSKYRKGGEEPAAPRAAEANVIIPAAPEFAIPSGWDGGATLPGESLSRHRRSEPRQDLRNQAPVQQAAPHREPAAPVVETRHEEAKPETPTDYEPTDASASYRVDPVAPSEFRQSAPIVEAPEEVREEATQEPVEQHDAASSSPVHTITPGPDEHVTGIHTAPIAAEPIVAEPIAAAEIHAPTLHAIFAEHFEPAPESPVASQTADTAHEKFDWQTPSTPIVAPVPHQITDVHSTGEMHSEAPVATFTPEPAAEAISPVLHETVISNPAENAVENGALPHHFAPGAGVVEEETLDDEDFNTTLHASSIEEMDDLEEEETLEGAADLGVMIREMSIDQITRSGGEEEQDDDLEEEDSIHDGNQYDLEDSEDEEEEDGDFEESDTEEDVLHEEFAEGSEASPSNGTDNAQAGLAAPSPNRFREGDRGRGRSDRGRRDGRRGDRDRGGRSDRSDRPRNTGGAGDRERSGGRDRRGGRSSMQSTNLPAISELLKPGQEILVQIAKEPIAKKGARITSHIALPGRFLVFMPTVNHTGVSRKIDSDGERRRLKEILLSEKGEASGGFIVRTAAEGASEEELRSDLRFLLNLWADIKQRSESSKSPALIYHDLNLVERILRDQVTDNFSAIWVDTETEYERVLRFLQRFQPSLIRRVKLYTKETPLFEQFGITEEINKALRSKVWLKSGGSIVINQTEALVAIDINTGKFVGKTARLEDTIVKTNLDAIPEIVRQIRLRDLGGIIIIDFIDMDERKNRNRVMAALEEELKNDRAPSKVLQFNDFGLVAITRKRVKQSLERTLSTTCGVCAGTGMVKSPVTVCNDIYIEMRKMQKHLDRGDVMLRVNPEVVKQLKAPGTKWLQEMEEMVGKTILVKSDPALHPEQFDIH